MNISCRHDLIFIMGIFALLPHNVMMYHNGSFSLNTIARDNLLDQLFPRRDKSINPVVAPTQHTHFSLSMSVNRINIDELGGKITAYAWVWVSWHDSNYTWDPKSFDSIKSMILPSRLVWKPVVTLFNSANKAEDSIGDPRIYLHSDGSIEWIPPVVYTVYCNLNFKKWPYDSHVCKFKVGIWTSAPISGRANEEDLTMVDWELISSRTRNKQEPSYSYLEYTIEVKRISGIYTIIVVTPAICIVFLSLSVFWIPPQMGRKLLLNGVIIAIVVAFLMYFAQMFPVSGGNTPLIVTFYSATLVLISLSSIISIVSLYMSTNMREHPVPVYIRQLLKGRLGNVVLPIQQNIADQMQNGKINSLSEEELNDSQQVDIASNHTLVHNGASQSSNTIVQLDWFLVATAFDRVCFLIYCIVFVVLTTICYL